jgi:hypothetical protein
MKIIIYTADAAKLKAIFIKDAKEDRLKTWKCTSNIYDDFLTHTPDQWVDKVILKFTPSDNNTELVVFPVYWNNRPEPSYEEKGTIMGRFAERLWIQYRDYYTSFESFV